MALTAVSRAVGEIELLVIGKTAPTKADWDTHCERVRERVAAHQLGSLVAVVSEGGIPSPSQRKQFLDIILPSSSRPKRVAVCTSSVVVRGVMTTFTWFGLKGMRAFTPYELSEALAWLAPTRLTLAELEAAVSIAKQECGSLDSGSPTATAKSPRR